MLRIYGTALLLLLVAVGFALFGFTGVADDRQLAANLCAGFFLVTAGAALVWALLNRSRRFDGPAPRR